MFRKFISIALLVSIIAVGSSGLMMIILGSFKFQLQMHPVHKIFGIIMCIASLFHVFYNFNAIKKYLTVGRIAISAGVLCAFLIFLFVVGMKRPLDEKAISEIENKMHQLQKSQQKK